MDNKQKISAGFLIRSRGLFLICHTTQDPDYIYSDSDPFWTIPKGLVEEGENSLAAALRETIEETGLNLEDYYHPSRYSPFHTYRSKSKKKYVIYYLDDADNKLFDFPFKCTSLIDNKRCPSRNGLPELDMFRWVSKEEAKRLIFTSFKHIFDLI